MEKCRRTKCEGLSFDVNLKDADLDYQVVTNLFIVQKLNSNIDIY